MTEKRGRGRPRKIEEEAIDHLAGIPSNANLLEVVKALLKQVTPEVKLGQVAPLFPVTRQQYDSWLKGKEHRVISEADICRLCWILVALLDGTLKIDGTRGVLFEAKRVARGRAQMRPILDRLLQAAGYEPLPHEMTYDRNIVWGMLSDLGEMPLSQLADNAPRLERRPLRVGYFDSPPLFGPDMGELHPRVRRELDPIGLGVELTTRLASYLGLEPTWHWLRNWNDLLAALRSRTIDLLGLRMASPQRLFGINFSRCIPELKCGVNALLDKEHLGYVMHGREIRYDELVEKMYKGRPFGEREIQDDWLSRLSFTFIPGNIGEFAHGFFRPAGGKQPLVFSSRSLPTDASPGTEWTDVIGHPMEDGRVRCYITGQLLCYDAMTNDHPASSKLVTLVELKDSLAPMGYAFGVAYTEERLLHAVNHALDTMFLDNKYLKQLYAHKEYHAALIESKIYIK